MNIHLERLWGNFQQQMVMSGAAAYRGYMKDITIYKVESSTQQQLFYKVERQKSQKLV